MGLLSLSDYQNQQAISYQLAVEHFSRLANSGRGIATSAILSIGTSPKRQPEAKPRIEKRRNTSRIEARRRSGWGAEPVGHRPNRWRQALV
jgi:hypothetical protein